MMKKGALAAIMALILGCGNPDAPVAATPEAPRPATGETPRLTADGWGPIRIGMTQAEVEAALGPDNDPEAIGGPDPEYCDQWQPTRAPDDMLVMIEDGRLTSIWLIDNNQIRTDRDIGLGATEATVRQTYGSALRTLPHQYLGPAAKYLTIWTRGAPTGEYSEDPNARGIRYETNDEGVVTTIGAGGLSIQHVEGCA